MTCTLQHSISTISRKKISFPLKIVCFSAEKQTKTELLRMKSGHFPRASAHDNMKYPAADDNVFDLQPPCFHASYFIQQNSKHNKIQLLKHKTKNKNRLFSFKTKKKAQFLFVCLAAARRWTSLISFMCLFVQNYISILLVLLTHWLHWHSLTRSKKYRKIARRDNRISQNLFNLQSVWK